LKAKAGAAEEQQREHGPAQAALILRAGLPRTLLRRHGQALSCYGDALSKAGQALSITWPKVAFGGVYGNLAFWCHAGAYLDGKGQREAPHRFILLG
jgi:hypothetical protein